MSKKWNIIFYETADGKCPVEAFINSRSINNRAKIFNWLDQLETHGPNLPRPYADLLGDGIHELRIKLSGDQIRIIYFFCYRNFIILTHAFTKSTNRVPEAEIRKSIKYREDFIRRFDEKKLRSK
ncbi:MAG: type II toxin-antitoxin system RelE/ParE family toxin [Spirochaetes bacterium]|nr:type II toxin-antitoxin system RelE/ParE family toxin [Spirochaetota bacterium]